MGKKRNRRRKRDSSRKKPRIIEEAEPVRKRSPYILPLIGLGFLAISAAGAVIYYSTRPSKEDAEIAS